MTSARVTDGLGLGGEISVALLYQPHPASSLTFNPLHATRHRVTITRKPCFNHDGLIFTTGDIRSRVLRSHATCLPHPSLSHTTPGHDKMNGEAADMATRRAAFQILKSAGKGTASARLGRLSLAGRKPIDTPNYVAMSSRGVIPHLTPDMVQKHTEFGAAHMALEDCKY